MALCQPAAAAAPQPGAIPVPAETVATGKALAQQSDLIVEGHLEGAQQAYPTGRDISGRKIVHYVQRIRVISAWKGSASSPVELLTSGVEPLPDADNPLNKTYTGPLVSGDYVFFLRKAGGTDFYTLNGLWQGLYPVFEGKSTALLANGGFAAFDQLSMTQFRSKVMSLAQP
ncbi:hypothetical protein D3C75_700500 [compost metagenome]